MAADPPAGAHPPIPITLSRRELEQLERAAAAGRQTIAEFVKRAALAAATAAPGGDRRKG